MLPQAENNPNRGEGFETVELRGVRFASLTQSQTVDMMFAGMDEGRGGWIITSNLDHLLRATRNDEFRAMLEQADAVVADGMPLVWASKVAGTPLPERVAGSTMTTQVAGVAAEKSRSVFLLGGNPGVADQAKLALQGKFPGIQIVGTHCPPVGFEKNPSEMHRIRQALNAAQPDLVLVALGSPKQENLIRRLRGEGVLPDAWWMGVGITLSFLSGEVNRAPDWMQRVGMEWVHRLAQEPKRLFRRYLIEGVPFALRLLAGSVMIRMSGKRAGRPLVCGGKD
ncbi:MAG: WecB/TagA/CpsF family glycosyltransferase [Planctomycetota bacterium]